SFDKLRMRKVLCGPWQMPVPLSLILSLSKDSPCPSSLTSPHLTSPHLTPPRLPSPPHTSPHLTSTHLTSPHLTSPHLTSPHLTSPPLPSPHLTSPHLTPPHHPTPHLTSPRLTSSHLRFEDSDCAYREWYPDHFAACPLTPALLAAQVRAHIHT